MTDAANILSFRSALRSCTHCSIHRNTGGPIPWSGDINPHYAILGEAPGKTEAAKGEPFVGDSGNILRHWLKQVGIKPDEVAYLNSVACWPARSPATPTDNEITNCRPWVHGQLEFIRPQILIPVGVVAFHQLREGQRWPKLANLHGKPMFHPLYKFFIWPTYHPSAYLHGRNKTYEKKITDDLKGLVEWESKGCPALDECYICEDELYRYDDWGIGLCHRHAQRQGILWPEDVKM